MNWKNQLYYGDNLRVLREHIPDETVDLVYLDPPFNSNASYNVLFKEKTGTESSAQIKAFDDTWHWNEESEKTYNELATGIHHKLADLIVALRSFLGTNDMMAYLVMMAARLLELRRVLKPTGSLYLHCDPTASHYLKLVMDAIFGVKNFRNEIVWCYKSRPQSKRHFGKKHDVLLFYSKSDLYSFNWQAAVRPLTEETIKKYKLIDEQGRHYRLQGRGISGSPIRSAKDVDPKWETTNPELVVRDYLDEKVGVILEDWWVDINILNQAARERLGYPTQKPESLLERIIQVSSNENDIVLDPFCGCGTTITVAERLNRKWVGIDITHLAITLMKSRLETTFGVDCSPYVVRGVPTVLEEARALKEDDPYQFQYWALGLINAHPLEGKKKGADRGIDGVLYFLDDDSGIPKKIIVQVKGGHINSSHIRDLRGTIERENAVIGAFITLEEPTNPMKKEALEAGFYIPKYFPDLKVPRLQILTIEGLLKGIETLKYPRVAPDVTFKRAEKKEKASKQQIMFD